MSNKSVETCSGSSEGGRNKVKSEPLVTTQQKSSATAASTLTIPSQVNIKTALQPLLASGFPLGVLPNGLTLNGGSLIIAQSALLNADHSLFDLQSHSAQVPVSNSALDIGALRDFISPQLASTISTSMPAVTTSMVVTQTAGVKRAYTDEGDDFSDDDSSRSDTELASSGSRMLRVTNDGAVDYSVTSPDYSSTDSGSLHARGTYKSRRMANRDAKLTPEEDARRRHRRERNKLAAAKCRQKRVDQTNQLLGETQDLEREQLRLEEEIKQYQKEKEELEFILEAHRLHCGMKTNANNLPPPPPLPTSTTEVVVPGIKVEDAEKSVMQPKLSECSVLPQGTSIQQQPQGTIVQQLSQGTSIQQQLHEASMQLQAQLASKIQQQSAASVKQGLQGIIVPSTTRRPTSFPTVTRSMVTQAIGIPILTPSNGIAVFTLGLDSMIDGHTGLTPITGFPSVVLQTPQSAPIDAPATTGISVKVETPSTNAVVHL